MGLKEYFSADLKAMLIYTMLGAISGYIAFVMNSPKLAFVSMLLILGVSTALMKYAFKAPNYKWFVGNGIVVFILMWFIVWTIFYNLATV